MKILLIGEFSGFHKNLKKGLESLGHDVTLMANGDGWKHFSGQNYRVMYYTSANNLFKKIVNLLYPFFMLSKYKGYDVVHFINPFVFSNHRLSEILLKIIRNNNKLVSLSACGTDPVYIESLKEFEYAPFTKTQQNEKFSLKEKNRFHLVLDLVNLIIPVMYDYWIGYKESRKCTQIIPLPIDLKEIKYKLNRVDEKIVIYHGITRRGFKGSDYIIEALTKIQSEFGNKVEVIITERISYDDYKNVLNKCNILIDQCKSQAYGVNAIIGMAMGKVVLSGSEEKAMKKMFSNRKCPVINIQPNKDQIYQQLKKLIVNSENIENIGEAGRRFVEQFHSTKLISAKYIEQWESALKNK